MDVTALILNTGKLRLRGEKLIVRDTPVWSMCGTWGLENFQGILAGGCVENQPNGPPGGVGKAA